MLPSRRHRIPSIRAHVLYTLETWSFHVSVLLNISPRCLCVLTWGMGTPFIRTSGLCFAVLPIASLLLGALKSMPNLSAQEDAVLKSEVRRGQLDFFVTFLRLQGDHHCACAQKWCHFSYFPRIFKQNLFQKP